ncbi:MAG: hypothetical protein FWE48_00950 [Coriobacteriia bacterium]|nr:hypothetical protein [Coriobacteriia bacterium]MCL2745648.1 hypothetical protein [Coriobacteriia bacterium]MCL2870509.1 hypothetical protein [Coriobacteriia bacterium]
MRTYSIRTEEGLLGKEAVQENVNLTEIGEALNQLKVQAFFAVEVSSPINNVDAIQIMFQGNTKGLFRKVSIPPEYTLDIVVKDGRGEDKSWYMSDTMGYEEMYEIVENFVVHQKLPNYTSWLDATKDMLSR